MIYLFTKWSSFLDPYKKTYSITCKVNEQLKRPHEAIYAIPIFFNAIKFSLDRFALNFYLSFLQNELAYCQRLYSRCYFDMLSIFLENMGSKSTQGVASVKHEVHFFKRTNFLMTYIIWIHFLMKCLKSYILKITFIYIFFLIKEVVKKGDVFPLYLTTIFASYQHRLHL